MKIPFSELPGRHERHFRRKLNNPLFPRPITGHSDNDLLEVQRLDHEELTAFIQHLQGLVVKAANLPPNADSDTILLLKEQLDKAFETSAGLADDQSGNQYAVRTLTEAIMKSIRKGASGDSVANVELDQEVVARAAHYALLEHAIVADLLHPETLIEADELAASLLHEPPEALKAALSLFEREQLEQLVAQAKQLVEGFDGENAEISARLDQMGQHLSDL